jgi:hypothetical protein
MQENNTKDVIKILKFYEEMIASVLTERPISKRQNIFSQHEKLSDYRCKWMDDLA